MDPFLAPELWHRLATINAVTCRPSPAQVTIDHAEPGHLGTAAEVEAELEASYQHDLAADRPDPTSGS